MPAKPTKRFYHSDKAKAEALAMLDSNGGNISLTSRQTGLPMATLRSWRDRGVHTDVAELQVNKRRDLADVFEEAAYKFVDHAVNTIDRSYGANAMTAAAIATDKMRLLRELPTSITADAKAAANERVASAMLRYLEMRRKEDSTFPSNDEIAGMIDAACRANDADAAAVRERVLGSPQTEGPPE